MNMMLEGDETSGSARTEVSIFHFWGKHVTETRCGLIRLVTKNGYISLSLPVSAPFAV